MPGYWWVNHKQTLRQEIEGEYLWSPKFERNGARSQFYDNMRLASPGDIVLSFANGQIGSIGRVADFAITAPKPEEFGSIGAYWDQEGWYLPVFRTPLRPPVRPKTLIDELSPLLPEKYSPISPMTGNGNQKAYLASITQDVFELLVAATVFRSDVLMSGGGNSLTYEAVAERLDDAVQRAIERDPGLDTTIKDKVIQARRGQGVFRKYVEARESACRLTGIRNPALLIASHIKPWRACRTANERLDGANGLLLTPDADHLFDRGFITFSPSGQVMVSQRVPDEDLRRLGFEQLVRQRFGVAETPAEWTTDGFPESANDYLAYHRKQVFVA
ncbi:HNH endonuclease signature motif containing protein [Brevundimonas sp. 2R-24]|uniref:HNH endonuclease signature motif containing protein n=1 Tax=Peiella sedimenti TaxID=3061083 RepID=A0ABT8SHC2_9CAUL|nr:HNH endonuclease signature motif containing protein [Caulobacteraceae bacterium XZ-24]